MKSELILLVDESRGQYLPQSFYDNYRDALTESDRESLRAILKERDEWVWEPRSDTFWQSWDTIIDNAVITLNGKEYKLYHDNDLWAYPADYDGDIEDLFN
jgi:hypothetical protein